MCVCSFLICKFKSESKIDRGFSLLNLIRINIINFDLKSVIDWKIMKLSIFGQIKVLFYFVLCSSFIILRTLFFSSISFHLSLLIVLFHGFMVRLINFCETCYFRLPYEHFLNLIQLLGDWILQTKLIIYTSILYKFIVLIWFTAC